MTRQAAAVAAVGTFPVLVAHLQVPGVGSAVDDHRPAGCRISGTGWSRRSPIPRCHRMAPRRGSCSTRREGSGGRRREPREARIPSLHGAAGGFP